MTNPLEREVANLRVRIRCPECRTNFHERLNRVIHGDDVRCPTCHETMSFSGIGHMHDHDTIADYVHHVEEHTCRPHFRG